jgi:broad specificity phosphatase PhoE
METKQVYLIRHGETELNKQRIVQGSGIDAPLNERGRAQAEAFFRHYREVPFERVISSALQRTVQTVEPFIELGIPYSATPLINEINWGTHEGKESTPEMIAAYQRTIECWSDGDLDASLPEGESARELMDRLDTFIRKLAEMNDEKILVCSHGRAIRGLITLFKHAPASYMEEVKHANTGLYLIDQRGEDWRIIEENKTSHL